MTYKTCKVCGQNLPNTREYFRRVVTCGKDVLTDTCKTCYCKQKRDKEWKDGKLLCHICGDYFDPDMFLSSCSWKYRDYKDYRCRTCRNAQEKQRRCNLNENESLRQLLQMRYFGAKERSKKYNIPFNITKDYLLQLWEEQNGLCAISNIPMTHKHLEGRVPTNVSIDQINPHKGYTIGNIQLVCMAVNQMKSDMSMEELYMFCDAVIRNARKWKH